MFELYTEPARRVVFMARYAASQTGNKVIETEHLLLGLLKEDRGLAQRFLGTPSAAEGVWKRIQETKPAGKALGPGDLPISNECKRVLAYAAEESGRLSNRNIGPEHLLLGLLREEKCFAAEILRERGVQLESVREELKREPHRFAQVPETQEEASQSRPMPKEIAEVQERLKSIVRRMEEAVRNHDFTAARACSDEERKERIKLRELHQQHGLDGWLFE
jgi:ATP-dependent Clp protease ATP-binding subunit ClpC